MARACAPTASPSGSAPATPRRARSFTRGPTTVPHTLRNPLYHWTHLELQRYFGIDELLDEKTADSIWERANEQLTTPQLSAHGILGKFRVRAVCTTDDPADPLDASRGDRGVAACQTKIYPTFRAERVHGSASARRLQRRGSTSSRRPRTSHIAQLPGSARRAAQAPRRLPCDRRAPLRPRPRSVLRGGLHRRTGEADLRPRAPARPRRRGARGVRVVPHGVLRPARRREGLDQAASPRRPAQLEHARVRSARPRHRLRLDRRLAADRRARRAISTASSRTTRCRRWSSTTSTRPTTTRSRR